MTRWRLVAVAVLLSGISVVGDDMKPKLSSSPMDADQLAVYQAFLASYTNGSKSDHLNLAMRTAPFRKEDAADECLKGVSVELANAESVIHEFDPQTLLSSKITLVDSDKQGKKVRQNDPSNTIRKGKPVGEAVANAFATGLLTLSEVAFDGKHQHAVMSFSFWCGGLCGHGETIVYQKTNGKWERTNRQCGGWIS